MNRLVTVIFTVATVTVFFGSIASANFYPVAPPGTFVTLRPIDFIQSVPWESPGLLYPNPVIGDNLGQHPGGFGPYGVPQFPGAFFIGVFGDPINTSNPDAAVYLWETTGGIDTEPLGGPQIQLGYWDPTVPPFMAFTPHGNPQLALYSFTNVWDNEHIRWITSSITPLSAFGITPAFPYALNAVRIEADWGHSQVTAVATEVVPEPATIVLVGTCTVALLSLGRQRRKQMRK